MCIARKQMHRHGLIEETGISRCDNYVDEFLGHAGARDDENDHPEWERFTEIASDLKR